MLSPFIILFIWLYFDKFLIIFFLFSIVLVLFYGNIILWWSLIIQDNFFNIPAIRIAFSNFTLCIATSHDSSNNVSLNQHFFNI